MAVTVPSTPLHSDYVGESNALIYISLITSLHDSSFKKEDFFSVDTVSKLDVLVCILSCLTLLQVLHFLQSLARPRDFPKPITEATYKPMIY